MRAGRPRTIAPDIDLSSLSDKPGVYILRDQQGAVVFVGGSTRVEQRVKRILRQKSFARAGSVATVEYIEVERIGQIVPLVETMVDSYKPFYNFTGTVNTVIRR